MVDIEDDGLEMDENGDVRPRKTAAVPAPAEPVLTDADITEMMRSELPRLVAHAIELAKNTTRLAEVMTVVKEINDRLYGRPAQAVEMRGDIKVTEVMEESTVAMLERFAEYALEKRRGNGKVIDAMSVEVKDA